MKKGQHNCVAPDFFADIEVLPSKSEKVLVKF